MPATQSARARVRAEVTREIIVAARDELAEAGPAGLSLRAVARRLEMVPSALYRYFPSRDALLTALIVDAYEAVGTAAAEADGAMPAAAPPLARWSAIADEVRAWAHEHPHEWALVYGSPVPGYEAPQDTIEAALKITRVITGIFVSATPRTRGRTSLPPAPRELAAAVAPIEQELLPGRSPEVVAAAMLAWTQLMGCVSMELFGHYKGATTDFDLVFDYLMEATGHVAGLR